eukprot:9171944-Pyramimonas_sp.AAC.1
MLWVTFITARLPLRLLETAPATLIQLDACRGDGNCGEGAYSRTGSREPPGLGCSRLSYATRTSPPPSNPARSSPLELQETHLLELTSRSRRRRRGRAPPREGPP